MLGKFISFEGPDGAGKTSVLKELIPRLKNELDNEIILTREPGGNVISESIRKIILDKRNTEMDARTEALLYAAARRQHIVEQIIPALQANKIVLCDRYVDSSVAYQGAGREIGEDEVLEMNQFAIDGLEPDITIYLDIESKKGIERIKKFRQNEINRLDVEELSFHEKVRKSYLRLSNKYPKRIKLIDAGQPFEVVLDEAQKEIMDNLAHRHRI